MGRGRRGNARCLRLVCELGDSFGSDDGSDGYASQESECLPLDASMTKSIRKHNQQYGARLAASSSTQMI